MFKTIVNAWKVPAVRKRLLYTLLLLLVFRFGTHVSVPFVNFEVLEYTMKGANEGVLGLVNLITGGAFSRLSIFAMSIAPYISASIIIQLLGMLIPSLEVMTKEGGEESKRKINKYTKMLTFALAAMQSIGLYLAYSAQGIFVNPGLLTGTIVVLALLGGTSFLVWLGEKISKKGIGNGVSMLIFAGIVSSVPGQLYSLFSSVVTGGHLNVPQLITATAVIMAVLIMITAVVFVQTAERRVPIQYARKIVGRKMYGGQNTYIPIKPIMAGVMPVIFAASFVTFPAMIIQIFFSSAINGGGVAGFLYNLSVATSLPKASAGYLAGHAALYSILIIAFTFFYTLAVFNPAEIATNIKQNGGFIPGIRAGKSTVEYLSNVVIKLTMFGALFLVLISIAPMIVSAFTSFNIAFGGTSILIIVGVAIEVVYQLESQIMMRQYRGFL